MCGGWQRERSLPDLQEEPPDVSVRVASVQLAQQQLSRQPLVHKIGHSAAFEAVKHPIQVTAILPPKKGQTHGRLAALPPAGVHGSKREAGSPEPEVAVFVGVSLSALPIGTVDAVGDCTHARQVAQR